MASSITNNIRRVAGFLYGVGARIHRGWMRRSAGSRGRLACAVVSVGGLTLGGAGKTPVAARVALGLSRRGYRVVLASRGYRGGSRERVTVVSDGVHVRSTVEAAGDEAFVLVAHAPGVPVIVGPDRRIVGHHAVALFDAEVLILDDGFQHHRLARDLDIVCVDGREGLGNGRVVPAGPLREPQSVLSRADWLCLVDPEEGGSPETDPARTRVGGAAQTDMRWVADRFGVERVVRARRVPIDLVELGGGEHRPLAWLAGRRVGMLAGIARPDSLRRKLAGLGASVETERIFPDHHAYRPEEVTGLDPSVDAWITSEKDAFKILPKWVGSGRVWVLRIEAEIDCESEVLDRLVEQLRTHGRLRQVDRKTPLGPS